MRPRRSRRASFDVQRLSAAVERPGIDPRSWVSMGRIDEDPEARRFEPGIGWIVDVEFLGSDVDQGDSVPCRVVSIAAGDGAGEYLPPPVGAEVLVEFPGGDLENGAVVVGYTSNEADGKPPEEVNGLPIEPELEGSTGAAVSPHDTEIKVSPHNRREQYALDRHVQARNHVIEAAEIVRLALRDAEQSYVRGERFVEVLQSWIDAVTSYVEANGAADAKIYVAVNLLAPGTVTPDEIADVAAAVVEVPLRAAAFQAAAVAGDALSERIKGD